MKPSLASGLALVWATVVGVSAAQPVENSSVIPIVIDAALDAAKARVGDTIAAKTLQPAWFHGVRIRKGTRVLGHVVLARAFTFDSTEYATQKPSVLSIRFDTLVVDGTPTELKPWVRALAHPVDALRAKEVRYFDEHDTVGALVQIGGDTYRPDGNAVFSADGDIVGYNRRDGVFARVLAGEYRSRFSHFACDATGTEEPVGVFSANSCGLYGFRDVYIADDGQTDHSGVCRLESREHTVKLYRGTTALLQLFE